MADRKTDRKSRDEGTFRVVPIEKDARMGEEIDGETYYRNRGDVVIQEAEVLEEKPLSQDGDGTLFRKSSDVQQAAYQIEHASQELEPEAPEVQDVLPDDEATRSVRRKKRKAFWDGAFKGPWYRSIWLYCGVGILLIVGISLFYGLTLRNYRMQADHLANRVQEISIQVDTGSGQQKATLDDEIDFYMDLSHEVRGQNDAFEQLNRQYWWLFGKRTQEDVGLAQLNAEMEQITPLLTDLDVFMQQVSQVVDQVLGTPSKPGHLLQALDLSTAQDLLQEDQKMIQNALRLCDGLEELPDSFVKGKENLEEQLRTLEQDVTVLQEYLQELSGLSGQVSTFCAAAQDFYNRPFADKLGTDLQAQYNVIVRSDAIQTSISQINEQSKYASLHRPYGISDFPLDEAGKRILQEEGVVQTARSIVLAVRQDDEKLAASDPSVQLCQTMIASNNAYQEQLRQLKLPDAYSSGVGTYLEALQVRGQYLEQYSSYAQALAQADAQVAKKEELQQQQDLLEDEIAQALQNADMAAVVEKTKTLESIMEQIEAAQEAYDDAVADAQPLLQEANKLHSRYMQLAG